MALQVWLPLNGNLNNQGLSGDATISGTPSYASGGKIADKYLNTSNMISIYVPSIKGSKICTFSFWAYAVSSTITSDWTLVARIDDQGTNAGSHMRFEICPKTNYNGIYCFSNHNNTNYGLSTGCIASPSGGYYDQWVHFCFTSDGTTFTRYMNGIKIGTCAYNGQATFSGNFQLANNDKCYKQDVCVYDHCLSAKEVAEISKGLVLHYPLSSQYETGMQNKYSGEVAAGNCTSGSFTVTKLTDERGYNYKLTYTGTGSNTWPNCKFGNFSFTAGKKYYYSVKVRCHSKNFSIQLRASRSDNDWVTNMTNILNPDGEWHEYYVYQTINSTYDRSGSTVTCNPVLEFYSESLSTADKVYSVDFDVKDVQVVESDCYVPFIENSYTGSSVDDCSGYSNNGTRSGTLAYSADSPRYDGCMTFSGSQFIAAGRTAMVTDAITVSWWGYMSDWSADQRAISCTEVGGWNFAPISSKMAFSVYRNGAYINLIDTVTLSSYSAGWHHFAATYDGYKSCLYADGVLKATSSATTTKYPITYNSSNGLFIGAEAGGNATTPVGNYFVGKLSDVRIYATALSADAIKQLYSSPISVDKSGNLYACEFKEV